MRLLLQTLIGVKSTKEIPVQELKQQVLWKMAIGITTFWHSATKRQQDTVRGEFSLHVALHIKKIKMFKISEATKMKKKAVRDDFAFRHHRSVL